ncbi:hypothetical protein GCM10022631_02380 [Deinococcus rubellus]|uniref:Uncharacterized protein n=1 Tax=Deinococcus rubellus TaxID=1889240 RepID=A0ABY5YIC3_9DEIO|nr:hypothetical protein [Deinococcus rubellus]UWX64819.1 hypothetical protein N0D28_03910 [Deinococcus rubellus]
MNSKLRIVQTHHEDLVIKSPSDKLIADAKAALGKAQGVLTVERKGTVYHLAVQHIIRLEVEQEDDHED